MFGKIGLMRLLRLTNSNDTNANVSRDVNKAAVGERFLSAAVGEPVETTIRTIWPSPDLPGLIDKWIRRYEPDMVFFLVSSYWFTYASIPTKIERKWGPIGQPIARAGIKIAGHRTIANNAAFRKLRAAAVSTIGGDPFFTPEEVVRCVEDCLGTIVAFEDVAVVVRGPRIPFAPEGSAAARRIAEERRKFVHRSVEKLCAQLHVEYTGWDSALAPQDDSSGLQGDFVHMNASLHAHQGEFEGQAMVRAWRTLKRG